MDLSTNRESSGLGPCGPIHGAFAIVVCLDAPKVSRSGLRAVRDVERRVRNEVRASRCGFPSFVDPPPNSCLLWISDSDPSLCELPETAPIPDDLARGRIALPLTRLTPIRTANSECLAVPVGMVDLRGGVRPILRVKSNRSVPTGRASNFGAHWVSLNQGRWPGRYGVCRGNRPRFRMDESRQRR